MERAPYVFKDTGDFQENQGKNDGNLYILPSQRLREETLTFPLRIDKQGHSLQYLFFKSRPWS
jgi:hypothetical protein